MINQTTDSVEFTIRDMGSQNGVFLNGERIKKSILSHGDNVTIGGHSFIFMSKAQTETTSIEAATLRTEIRKRFGPEKRDFLPSETDFSNWASMDRIKRDLETIYKISNLVSSGDTPERLFRRLLGIIMEAIPADRGFILLAGLSSRKAGEGGLPFEIAAKSGPDDGVSFSQTVVNETVKSGVSILTVDPMSEQERRALAETLGRAPGKPLSQIIIEERGE